MSQDEFVASAAIDEFSGFPVSPLGRIHDLDIINEPSARLEGSWSVCWPRLVLWRLDNGYWGSGVTHQGVDLFTYASFQRSALATRLWKSTYKALVVVHRGPS